MNITLDDIKEYREDAYGYIKELENPSVNIKELAKNYGKCLCDDITILCDFVEDLLSGIR